MSGAGGGRLTSIAQRHRRGLLVAVVGLSIVVPGVSAHAATPPTPPTPPSVPTASDPTTSTEETTSATEPTIDETIDPTLPATEPLSREAAAPDTTADAASTAAPDTGAAPPPTTAPLAMPTTWCNISAAVVYDARGPDALCVEWRLTGLGYSLIGPDDWFGVSSVLAVKAYQRTNGLPSDGIVNETTARRLGIWIGQTAPKPEPAAQEAASGVPANSGTGRRVVYDRSQQRVWAVEADGTVVKTHLVSGRLREPYAGTYSVYSRSMYTYSTENPDVKWRYMVRFAYGPGGGRIGFHEIPVKFGVPLQSVSQLGQPLSGGCVRQSTPDAQWMWDWAQIGTKVVVL